VDRGVSEVRRGSGPRDQAIAAAACGYSDDVGPTRRGLGMTACRGPLTDPAGIRAAAQSRRLVAAHRVSSLRLDSWSLRSTLEAWDSTVFTEMNSREPISR